MRKACAIALILSVGLNVWLAYRLLDAAVSLDDAYAETGHLNRHRKVAIEAIRSGWKGRARQDAEEFVQRMASLHGAVVEIETRTIHVGELRFIIGDGKIISVEDAQGPP
jgi:chromosome segregation and condensation protein ScpB